MIASRNGASLRFSVEHQKFNRSANRDTYPIPRIDECIEFLEEIEIFSTLNVNSAYFQVEVDEVDQKMTCTSPHGLYRFPRMSCGLNVSMETFRQAMIVIPSLVKWQYELVCLDRIVVFCAFRTSTLHKVRHVLN